MTLTVGSLFSGIGGIEAGLERAGITTLFQVEIDQTCQRVLAHHWPDVTRFEDVTNAGRFNLPDVDVLTGGFPCQDLSVAGRRAGLAGERSGLWWQFHRIIDELRPRWVVIENVPGLLSSNEGRDMGTLLHSLGELGYWWAYRVLDAQWFGVAQRRRRVFIVGHSGDRAAPATVLLEPDRRAWNPPPRREAGERITGTTEDRPRNSRAQVYGIHGFNSTAMTSNGTAQAAYEVDTARSLDTTGGFATYQGGNLVQDIAGTLGSKAQGGFRSTDLDQQGAFVPHIADAVLSTEYKGIGHNRENNIVAHGIAMRGRDGGSTPELTTEQVSALRASQGGGDKAYVAAPITPSPYADHLSMESRLIAHTLSSEGDKPEQGYPAVMDGVAVRRLTPLECLRLQGFPDYWLDIPGLSDSAKYRMVGNAVCANVAEWIGKRIMEYEYQRIEAAS